MVADRQPRTYTHPGWNDTIDVKIGLPLKANWNGRFQGTGGGGWRTGYGLAGIAPAMADGYSAAATNGGHEGDQAATWALSSPGNINYPELQDFAAIALADMTMMGQQVTESYYGCKAERSYWTGCSTGGRQGMMLAQRYPHLYDGIMANAPAINWDYFVPIMFWPQLVMSQVGFVEQCELDAYTAAAVKACDDLDGLKDGIIADENACTFDAQSAVGQSFSCDGAQKTLTKAGATVANAVWNSAVDASSKHWWYGYSRDAPLSGVANTTTAANGTTGAAFNVAIDWLRYFIAKDASFDPYNYTNEQYFEALRQSHNQYQSITGTSDPDLSPFKANGGKLITFHGLADQLIPPNGTVDYYQRVMRILPETQEFYRIFEAPGVHHCNGGPGPQVTDQLETLVAWVEKGIAPDTLKTANETSGVMRDICAWPKQQRYNGGEPKLSSSFDCV